MCSWRGGDSEKVKKVLLFCAEAKEGVILEKNNFLGIFFIKVEKVLLFCAVAKKGPQWL